jgi:hypothetical protein
MRRIYYDNIRTYFLSLISNRQSIASNNITFSYLKTVKTLIRLDSIYKYRLNDYTVFTKMCMKTYCNQCGLTTWKGEIIDFEFFFFKCSNVYFV